jgi:phosphatidate cytidylyltransferase
MSNLAVRVLTAVVAAPVLMAVILWPHPLPLLVVVLLATVVGMHEWQSITLAGRPLAERLPGILVGVCLGGAVVFGSAALLLVVLAGATMVVFLTLLARHGDLSTVGARLGTTLAGVLYVGLLLSFLTLLKRRPDGAHGEWVLVALTVTWFGDTTAYFAGRAFGRHKLYPAISPGKTIEGSLGGLLGSLLAVVLAKQWYLAGVLSFWDVPLLALPGGVLGQVGDLCESMVKRAYGVKDSGVILPGHGGLLDRIDALLFTAPFVFMYAAARFGG